MSKNPAEPRAGIPSPCINVCCMEPDGLCAGCLRTRDEIARWGGADDAERLRILAAVAGRRAARGTGGWEDVE